MTDWLKICPLTIFVGENSSGKSSIVRSFPLFKQSTESKTLGTVLWSGKYVDYGSFIESINGDSIAKNSKSEICFAFSFIFDEKIFGSQMFAKGTRVSISIKVYGNEYLPSSYTIFEYNIFDNVISLKYDAALKILEAKINGIDFTRQVAEYYSPNKSYSITPVLYPKDTRNKPAKDSIAGPLVRELRRHVHHRTSDETLMRAARNLRFNRDEFIKRQISSKTLFGEVGAQRFSSLETSDQNFKAIKNQIILCDLGRIVDHVGDYLYCYFSSLRYITPLRAAADRYYRIQNTSIDELDPNGSNLAMFLHAKNSAEIINLNEWLSEEIGFKIEMEKSQGHTSIFVIDENGRRSNIADTGFGFSQILPILIQMWQSSKFSNGKFQPATTPETVVIEQPELHLHPRMQAQVGKMFCKVLGEAKKENIDLRVIIETHSRDIIDSVGRSIEKGILNSEDVCIYIVEKKNGFSITKSSYDAEGFLVNWPYGFFDGE